MPSTKRTMSPAVDDAFDTQLPKKKVKMSRAETEVTEEIPSKKASSTQRSSTKRTGPHDIIVPPRDSKPKTASESAKDASGSSGKKRKVTDEDEEDEDDEPVAHKRPKRSSPPSRPAKSTYTGTMRQSRPYSAPRTQPTSSRQTSARPQTSTRPASQTSSRPARMETSPMNGPTESWRNYLTPEEIAAQAEIKRAAEQRRADAAKEAEAVKATQNSQPKFRNRATVRTITKKVLPDGTKQLTETSERPAPTSTFFAGYRPLETESPKEKFDLKTELAKRKAAENGERPATLASNTHKSTKAQGASTTAVSTVTEKQRAPINGTKQAATPQKPSTAAKQHAPATTASNTTSSVAGVKRKAPAGHTEEPRKRNFDPSRILAAKTKPVPKITFTAKPKQREASKPTQQKITPATPSSTKDGNKAANKASRQKSDPPKSATTLESGDSAPKPSQQEKLKFETATTKESSESELNGTQSSLGGDGGSRARDPAITKPPKTLPTSQPKVAADTTSATKKDLAASPAKAVAKVDEIRTAGVKEKPTTQKPAERKVPEPETVENEANDNDSDDGWPETFAAPSIEQNSPPPVITNGNKTPDYDERPKNHCSSPLDATNTSPSEEPPKRKSTSPLSGASSDDSTKPKRKGVAVVKNKAESKRKPRTQHEKEKAAYDRRVNSFFRF